MQQEKVKQPMQTRKVWFAFVFVLGVVIAPAQLEQRYVVLPKTEGRGFIGIKMLGLSTKVTGTWQPTQNDVADPEANLHQISDFPKSNYAWKKSSIQKSTFASILG
ncbi:MAG: hypothetical protein WBP85_17325 [Terracidiphilus sp.]